MHEETLNINLNINIGLSPELCRVFGELRQELGLISKGQTQIMKELEDLKAQVAANTSVEKSALALIQGFAAKLDAAKADPAALEALSAELKASDDELAAAITANTTPAETTSEPAPTEAPTA